MCTSVMGGKWKPFNFYSKAASSQDSVVWKLQDGNGSTCHSTNYS